MLNVQHSYERAFYDDSPFADVWQFCERFEYGWPMPVLAVPLTSDCSVLPAFNEIGFLFDAYVCGALVAVSGFVFGRYQRRTFLDL
jgi:hypothetical protein